jgi:hypothetical protein
MLRWTVLSRVVLPRRSFCFREVRMVSPYWDPLHNPPRKPTRQEEKIAKRKPTVKKTLRVVDEDVMGQLQELLSVPTSPLYDAFHQSVQDQMPFFLMKHVNDRGNENNDADLRTKEYHYPDPFIDVTEEEDIEPSSVYAPSDLSFVQGIFESLIPLRRRPRRYQPQEFMSLVMQLHQRILTDLYLQVALANHKKKNLPHLLTNDEAEKDAQAITASFMEYFYDVRLVLRVFWIWSNVTRRCWRKRKKDKSIDPENPPPPPPPPPKVEEALSYLLYISHLSPSNAVFSMKTVAVLVPLTVRQAATASANRDAPIVAQDFIRFMRNVLESPWIQHDPLDIYNTSTTTLLPMDLSSGFIKPQKVVASIDVFANLVPLWVDSNRPDTKECLTALLQEMEDDGVRPNASIFAKLMPFYARHRGVNHAMNAFVDAVEHNPRLQPDITTLTEAVTLLMDAKHYLSAHRILNLAVRLQIAYEKRSNNVISQRIGIVLAANRLLAAHRVAMKDMVHSKFRGAARMAKASFAQLDHENFLEYIGFSLMRKAILRTMMYIGDLERRPRSKRPQKKRKTRKQYY